MPFISNELVSIFNREDIIKGKVEEEASDFLEREDLKKSFRYTDIIDQSKQTYLKNKLAGWLSPSNHSFRISSEVLSRCFQLIDMLYPSLFEELEIDQVYSTDYGTVVFDWEKDVDNVFSLEVGAQQIGYFIEVDGRDIKQIDQRDLVDSKKELLQDLNEFLAE